MNEVLLTISNPPELLNPVEKPIEMARCVHPSFCRDMGRCMANCDGDSPLIVIADIEQTESTS